MQRGGDRVVVPVQTERHAVRAAGGDEPDPDVGPHHCPRPVVDVALVVPGGAGQQTVEDLQRQKLTNDDDDNEEEEEDD